MRRRQFRKPVVNLTLFPFLAVLICTMGALIVLLVLMVLQARTYAAEVVESVSELPADAVPPDAERTRRKDDFDWRRDILLGQRTELRDKLADSRLQLSHLEDHIRRLNGRWHRVRVKF